MFVVAVEVGVEIEVEVAGAAVVAFAFAFVVVAGPRRTPWSVVSWSNFHYSTGVECHQPVDAHVGHGDC